MMLRQGGRYGEESGLDLPKSSVSNLEFKSCGVMTKCEVWVSNREFVGGVRYLSKYWREFVPEKRDSCGYGVIGQF